MLPGRDYAFLQACAAGQGSGSELSNLDNLDWQLLVFDDLVHRGFDVVLVIADSDDVRVYVSEYAEKV